MYNMTNFSDTLSLYEVILQLNLMTNYKFSIALLVGITIIVIVSMIKSGVDSWVSIVSTGGLLTVFSIFMMFADFLTPDIAFPFIIVGLLISSIGVMIK